VCSSDLFPSFCSRPGIVFVNGPVEKGDPTTTTSERSSLHLLLTNLQAHFASTGTHLHSRTTLGRYHWFELDLATLTTQSTGGPATF